LNRLHRKLRSLRQIGWHPAPFPERFRHRKILLPGSVVLQEWACLPGAQLVLQEPISGRAPPLPSKSAPPESLMARQAPILVGLRALSNVDGFALDRQPSFLT